MLVRFNDRRIASGFGPSRGLPSSSSLRRELDRLFGDLERAPFGGSNTPTVEFADTGEALTLRAELPGLSEKDVDISVTANVLTLKAARKVEAPEGYAAHRRERQGFSFTQSYELPARIDPEKVQATLRQGVLTLTLPKASDAQPKRVTVSASA